jgi:hypothetical protein
MDCVENIRWMTDRSNASGRETEQAVWYDSIAGSRRRITGLWNVGPGHRCPGLVMPIEPTYTWYQVILI